jgi:DNA-binding NarL/FixJ family response regulator
MRHITTEEGTTPVGVLIVDDQILFRHAAREVVEATHPDFVLIGEASSGEHALATVGEVHPDLVLIYVRMAGMDGVETSRRMHAVEPRAVIVLVTVDEPLNLPADVGFCGASDLIRKQDFRPALLRRLWRLHGEERPPSEQGVPSH